jgi:hypothetical protein
MIKRSFWKALFEGSSQAPKSQINSNIQAFKSQTKKAAVIGFWFEKIAKADFPATPLGIFNLKESAVFFAFFFQTCLNCIFIVNAVFGGKIAHVLSDFHRAELRTAHRAELRFLEGIV